MAAFLLYPVRWLELEATYADNGRTLRRVPAAAGDAFSISYIHSVEQHEVVELFSLTETDHIVLTGTRYRGFGAGLPTDAGEGTFRLEGDEFVIEGLHRQLDELQLRLNPINDYTLRHRRETYRWPDAPSGSRLRIRTVRAGRLPSWLHVRSERRGST